MKSFFYGIAAIITFLVIGAGEYFLPRDSGSSQADVSESEVNEEVVQDLSAQSLSEKISQNPAPRAVAVVDEDLPPILKNLGIILDTPNLKTRRAGDLLFDMQVVWEDGGSYSDKAFGDFGELGKRKDVPNYPGVEFNFAVPTGTHVYAAGDGIVRVFYIEHTLDWGINIQPREGSKWNIGQEHIINLRVKDGDIVWAGDILGEASPNRMGYATTQLAVWTGGRGIIKYCPFSFLEDSLEPVYQEKLVRIAKNWEEFTGKNVYQEENWIAPGCLLDKIVER